MSKKYFAIGLFACAMSLPVMAAPPANAQEEFMVEIEQLRGAMAKASPTDAEVGDADSFGRNVKWNGVLQTGVIALQADCTPLPGDPAPLPDDRCVTLNPAPAATAFDFANIGRMTLPGRSANSLLCHWLSPIVFYGFSNNTGVFQPNAQFRLTPYVEVISAVLDDPTLIDPTTGAPFGGKLQTGFSASYLDARSLSAGDRETHRFSESRTCIAGFLTRRALIEVYGLSEALADKVFRKDITLQFGLRGSAALVENASVLYGLRVVGD